MMPREISSIRPAARNDEASLPPPISQARRMPRAFSCATTASGLSDVTVIPFPRSERLENTHVGVFPPNPPPIPTAFS